MPPPAQGSQGKEPDNAFAVLWIIGLAFIVGALLWYALHDYIVMAVFHLKLAEAYVVSLFTHSLANVINIMRNVALGEVTVADLWAVSTAVGNVIRYPLIFILVVLAAILYTSDITQRYRKTYSMKSLRDEEQVNWPHITPIIKLDLIKQDVDKGPWAVALTPRAFATRNKLIKRDLAQQQTMRLERGYVFATIHRGEAKRLFAMQIGNYWTGVDALPPHTKALFALFAAKMNRDREIVSTLLTQFSRSSGKVHMDYSGVNGLLAKHWSSQDVQKIVQQHAYVLTVMASMLAKAREDGVLSTAEFLWLKPVDRRLWYMLNSVGRQTPFTEVAGPFAHWLAEKVLYRPCLVPIVTEAVNGLETAIKEIKFKEDEVTS